MDGKEFWNGLVNPWIQKCKWGAVLVLAFTVLTVCKLLGFTVQGGIETPIALTFISACLIYAGALWAHSRRDPDWTGVCSYIYGVRPDDKSIIDYITFKYNLPKLFLIAAGIMGLTLVLMFLFLGGNS